MNNKLLLIILSTLLIQKSVMSQDFLEVKYSINDITTQRNNFRQEKIKAVIMKIDLDEIIYKIDEDGKILKKVKYSDPLMEVIYNYENLNLVTTYSPATGERNFKYDLNGNVTNSIDASTSKTHFFDSKNRLLRFESEMESEEGEGTVGADTINYTENLVIEEIFPVSIGFYDRTTYEYSESNQLISKKIFSRHSTSDKEDLISNEKYLYIDNSILPFKMIIDNQEIIFVYEYHK